MKLRGLKERRVWKSNAVKLALLLPVLLITVLWLTPSRHGETYDGKPFSYWFSLLPSHELSGDGLGYSIALPSSYELQNEAESRLQTRQTYDAIDAIGTNHLNFLLSRLQAKDSPLLLELWELGVGWRLLYYRRERFAQFQHGQALVALHRLGDGARPIYPQLLQLTTNSDTNVQMLAWHTIERIAPDEFDKLQHPNIVRHLRPWK